MADTTQTSAPRNFIEQLKSYVQTRKGMILTAEIAICFIIIICYASSLFRGYIVAAIVEMVFAIIFFIVYTMELDKDFKIIHWPWSDFFRAASGSLIFLITSLICVIRGSGDTALIFGGVFGFVAGVLFGYDAFILIKDLRSSQTPQCETTVAFPASSVSNPTLPVHIKALDIVRTNILCLSSFMLLVLIKIRGGSSKCILICTEDSSDGTIEEKQSNMTDFHKMQTSECHFI